VKHRDLVALGEEVDLSDRGESLPAQLWKDRLASRDAHTLVLDVRNDYEWEVGHFEGAMRPDCKTFKDFPRMARRLKEEYSPQSTQLLIYCTGGIRCEWYAPLLRREGFEHIYRLEGGLLRYGSEVGTAYWQGKVFVFDDRLVVPICEEKETEVIGKCCHCGKATENCYNCTNMSCNRLFLSCLRCSTHLGGCCSQHCCSAPRKREFVPTEHPKPFRRLSQEERGRLISK